ncbi:MAG TPA: hypothetical protein VFH58_14270 [Acidimicrobiales bacterium]|nr:hypothetical protein [Acidimicrobiales bacterium]
MSPQEVQDRDGQRRERGSGDPSPTELREALARYAHPNGSVPSGIAARLSEELGWSGRSIDVLAVLGESGETLGYLAGGRHPDEVATWVSVWAESPLSLEDIRLVTHARGWEPDPFVVLADAGLLERALTCPDGSPRRIRGELAGTWISDELALAGREEILQRVQAIIDEEPAAE